MWSTTRTARPRKRLKLEGKLSTRSVPPAWAMTVDIGMQSMGTDLGCRQPYVMDGGVFVSNPHKNCTITILTLAMRNATRTGRATHSIKGALTL